MTVDATLRSIYFAADETIASFDRLHMTTQAQRSRSLQQLEGVVAGLDGSFGGPEEAPSVQRRERNGDRVPTSQDPEPFVALPKRTTHGGPWGPKVAAKLRAAALEKRGW